MAGGDTERSILVAIDEVPSAFWTELEDLGSQDV